MSPLASYRRLLGLAGPLYVLVAFLGRLPVSMCQLGTLLLVSSSTGSYGVGGLATGALAVSNAVGAPLAAAVADRVGQRPVVLVQSLAGAAALATLVTVTLQGAPTGVLVLIAGAITYGVGKSKLARSKEFRSKPTVWMGAEGAGAGLTIDF